MISAGPKVPNEELVESGLELMRQNGMPLERIQSGGRSMIYRLPDDRTVRVRTCNDHVLVVLAETPDQNANLNIENTDLLLIVMPEVPRTRGPVHAYLVPTDVAVQAARTTHAQWLASNPSTKGQNRTWNLWFDDNGPAKANGFARTWASYRLQAKPSHVASSASSTAFNETLGDVIAACRRRIATAAGVPELAVKISIDFHE